jgi:hypothetical protein
MTSHGDAVPLARHAVPDVSSLFTTEAIRLEELLADRGVAARVGDAAVHEQGVLYPLQLGLGATVRHVLRMSREVAREAGYSSCRLRRVGQGLFLEVPLEERLGARYGDLLARADVRTQDEAPLGMLQGGDVVSLAPVRRGEAPVLVVGHGRSASTNPLRVIGLGMVLQHAPRQLRLAMLAQGDGSSLAPLRQFPHCWAWSEAPVTALGWLVCLLDDLRERETSGRRGPTVLALVEDVESMLDAGGDYARDLLRELLVRGPARNIHCMIGCERVEALQELQSLFPVRLVLEGQAGGGQMILYQGRDPTPLVAAQVTDAEIKAAASHYRRGRPVLVAGRPRAEGRS